MSGDWEKCGKHCLDCVCDDDEITTTSPFPKDIEESLLYFMIHSKFPKRNEKGEIIWKCKEGC